MKLSRLFNSLPKRLAAGALIALAVVLPVAASAADTVNITATTGVANVTAGDTTYSPSVSAKYNEVVKVQVSYNNTEVAGSGKVANNLRVKINIPTTAGVNQTVSTTTSADNSNTVTGSAAVTLDGADAYMQYIPGSAVWAHAVSANSSTVTTQKISDDVATNANGAVLENENPCQSGSVTVLVGVMVPGVSVNKYVRAVGSTTWATSMNANAGDTVQYEISYHNTGNTTQNNVVIRDNLPPNMTLVPGTTYLKDTSYPSGTLLNDDDVTGNGIVIGTYGPGAVGYVMFNVKVPTEDKLQCGENQFRNVGIAQPQGMNEYYNTADVNVNKTCTNTPVYNCSAFTVVADNSTRTVTVNNFAFTASDNSTLDLATVNWGDTQTTDSNTVKGLTHTYAQDGSYTINLSNFKVGGKTVNVNGNCSQTVNFTSTPTTTTPTVLPNTGAGNVIGIFVGAVVAGTIAGRLFLSRKLARR